MNKPLTLLSAHGGCAAKIGPHDLRQIIDGLKINDPAATSLLQCYGDVGLANIAENLTIAQSVDVITPVSDKPAVYGKIATAHALSDLYAKGARPILGLFVLGIPPLQVSVDLAREILQGAIDKLYEANARLMGGHTFASQQLELGVAVTGLIENDEVLRNTCKDGDVLILTKPLGNGVIATAQKLTNSNIAIEMFSNSMVIESENTMLGLNEFASNTMLRFGANACTDVSGFGLIGHLCQLLGTSNLTAVLNWDTIPTIAGAITLAEQMILPANCERNAAYWWKECKFEEALRDGQKMLLFDPQTSGGLLMSVEPNKADLILKELAKAGLQGCASIGRIVNRQQYSVIVTS